MFAIWLEPVELIAVDGERARRRRAAGDGRLDGRSGSAGCLRLPPSGSGRELRFASEPEVRAFGGAERRVNNPDRR